MRVGVIPDNTIALNLPALERLVSTNCKTIEVKHIDKYVRFCDSQINFEAEYAKISKSLKKELKENDLVVVITTAPFANSYFYTGLKCRFRTGIESRDFQ